VHRAFCLCLLTVALWTITLWQEFDRKQAQSASGTPDARWILIEVDLKRLTLYEGTEQLKRYPIATGAWKTPSPIGAFRITDRFVTEMSGFGTRFLRLNVPYGIYGIHGTSHPESIGSNASHGCFRLRVKDAEELYDLVPNGTKVYVEGGSYGLLGDSLRTLHPGDRCSHVQEVQKRLQRLGFYQGSADGVYGENTSRAVLKARKSFQLNHEDVVDAALYQCLGIVLFE